MTDAFVGACALLHVNKPKGNWGSFRCRDKILQWWWHYEGLVSTHLLPFSQSEGPTREVTYASSLTDEILMRGSIVKLIFVYCGTFKLYCVLCPLSKHYIFLLHVGSSEGCLQTVQLTSINSTLSKHFHNSALKIWGHVVPVATIMYIDVATV